MTSRTEVPTYRPYQRSPIGKSARVRRATNGHVQHQWFAVEPSLGVMSAEQYEAIERVFYGGKQPAHGLYDLCLSFLFSDGKGGRQTLLRVSGTLARRVVFRLDTKTWCRLVAVSSKDSTDEREADLHFFAL